MSTNDLTNQGSSSDTGGSLSVSTGQKVIVAVLIIIVAYILYRRMKGDSSSNNNQETQEEVEDEDVTSISVEDDEENIEIPDADKSQGGLNQDKAFIDQVHAEGELTEVESGE